MENSALRIKTLDYIPNLNHNRLWHVEKWQAENAEDLKELNY